MGYSFANGSEFKVLMDREAATFASLVSTLKLKD
jgi:hypothetical protein